MGKRSRKRRVFPSGAPGIAPSGPHDRGQDDPPSDGGGESGGGGGGVREPRRPKPVPPSLTERAPLPGPPVHAEARAVPADEVTRALAAGQR